MTRSIDYTTYYLKYNEKAVKCRRSVALEHPAPGARGRSDAGKDPGHRVTAAEHLSEVEHSNPRPGRGAATIPRQTAAEATPAKFQEEQRRSQNAAGEKLPTPPLPHLLLLLLPPPPPTLSYPPPPPAFPISSDGHHRLLPFLPPRRSSTVLLRGTTTAAAAASASARTTPNHPRHRYRRRRHENWTPLTPPAEAAPCFCATSP